MYMHGYIVLYTVYNICDDRIFHNFYLYMRIYANALSVAVKVKQMVFSAYAAMRRNRICAAALCCGCGVKLILVNRSPHRQRNIAHTTFK